MKDNKNRFSYIGRTAAHNSHQLVIQGDGIIDKSGSGYHQL
ncbi:hypothetical protein [Clostridium transplantifaecale]|nr:hypothetical protein [Clostridium transplantifaecale]